MLRISIPATTMNLISLSVVSIYTEVKRGR